MVWGYWVASWISNVAIITSLAGYLTSFFPILTDKREMFSIGGQAVTLGQLLTFAVCTVLLWGTHTILVTSINGASKLNFVTTFSKVLGFIFFIIAGLFVFQTSFFDHFIFRFKQVLTQLRESADRSTMRRFQHYGRSSELNRQSFYPGAPVRSVT